MLCVHVIVHSVYRIEEGDGMFLEVGYGHVLPPRGRIAGASQEHLTLTAESLRIQSPICEPLNPVGAANGWVHPTQIDIKIY